MNKNIKAEVVTITAEKAKTLLANNTNNRDVKPAGVAQIKTALQRGEWKLNGEAIKIAEDGTILDGQHRLIACMETGIAFQTLLVTGLSNDTQDTMDTGIVRTVGDVLKLNGYTNSVGLAASTLAIIRAEQYSIRAATVSSGGSAYPVTRRQVLDRVKAEPTLEDVSRYGKKFSKIGIQGRLASLLWYEFSKINSADAEYFFEKLLTGEALDRGNPILTVRNILIALKNNEKGTRNQTHTAGLVIKAWNKFRDGEDALRISYTAGGANPDSFPEPK